MHDPYHVGRRKPLTDKQRLELFVAHKGICCICDTKIKVGEAWWDEHELALWLAQQGGPDLNDMTNRGPAHVRCARVKTDKEAGDRSKVRAMAEAHYGAKRAKTKPMPFGRRSKLKRKMSGEVVER